MTDAAASAPALALHNLTFAHSGATDPVLKDCSWEVPAGSFALLVGGTGSGKSTLLSLCKPQIAPAGERSGKIEVFGRAASELSDAESARTVGYVFQSPENQIVCDSVWHEMAFGLENLGAPQDEMRRRIAETSYFFGMEDWFREQTDALSGGRKQLLALAAVLVMRPRLLLLDEPTSQLDPIAEKNFLHALFRVNRELGCTVVVATHRPRPMLDYATCAFELSEGKVREVSDMSSLGERAGLLKQDTSAATASMAPCVDAVALKGAWFKYPGSDRWVLRGLDLRLAPGAVHTLVGGNGCGKSTLLGVLAKSNRLRRGSLKLGAAPCALLPQDPRALFAADTALGELMEWADTAGYGEAQARAMLAELGLGARADLHPYDLSGGQQQLLALGKLLLLRPQLLLLDEPTKGLDLAARRKVAQVLRERTQAGATVVMATHDLDFAEQVADDVSLMFDGELACTEPTGQFFAGNVYYRP